MTRSSWISRVGSSLSDGFTRRSGIHDTGMATRCPATASRTSRRSEEHTSELQSLMRISYAVFCLKKKKKQKSKHQTKNHNTQNTNNPTKSKDLTNTQQK